MKIEKKISVGILGATGSVGQKFIELLNNHPWFDLTCVAASERSAGKRYGNTVNWFMQSPLPGSIADMEIKKCQPDLPCKIVFSALDASVAGEIEEDFARAGYIVLSNARNHRYDVDVPLLVPEVNYDHMKILDQQNFGKGKIITNPNCSTTGLVVALKPLFDSFGIELLNVVTLQALSGAGYPGIASVDAIDNILPFINGEEDKMELEPLKILGELSEDIIVNADIKISATCNRVPVIDGHVECVSLKLKSKTSREDLINAFNNFSSLPQELQLPTAPSKPIYYFHEENLPQPRLLRNIDKGMAVSIGRLRECSLFDYKFTLLSHNTVRGAAGGAILNAELLLAKGYIS